MKTEGNYLIRKCWGNFCKLNKGLLASKHDLGASDLVTSSPADPAASNGERATKKPKELSRHCAER